MSEPKDAIVVGVLLPTVSAEEQAASLAELERLVSTLGYRPVARVTQARPSLSPAAVLGEGKLKELAELTGGSGRPHPSRGRKTGKVLRARLAAEREEEGKDEHDEEEAPVSSPEGSAGTQVGLVAVDHDLSPSQARNLEHAAGGPVLDRTGVIIEIFHRHARSREARLQVEMARLKYLSPRVRESPSGKERQAGRGAGEAAIELDRRRIRDRIAELKEQLEAVQKEQGTRRAQRRDARRVVLVGYTNAGKSSLMRALTGSGVLVEDRLFATLDTTVRALTPETKPRILVSDTVGFIRDLPHDLVASFKSTLDEALDASLLLQVVDASDPSAELQTRVTTEVLAEIGAADVSRRVVMNKIDRLSPEARAELERSKGDAWLVSAHEPASVLELRSKIVAFFEEQFVTAELLVPYDRQAMIRDMHETGRVEEERYEEDGVHVRFRGGRATVDRLKSLLPTDPDEAISAPAGLSDA
jgi:GTP-binding protein HflX